MLTTASPNEQVVAVKLLSEDCCPMHLHPLLLKLLGDVCQAVWFFLFQTTEEALGLQR